MFKNMIDRTPLTSEAANDFFADKITGDSFSGDISFLATLRALLHPRMQDDDYLNLRFTSSTYSADQLRNLDTDYAVSVIAGDVEEHTIRVHRFARNDQPSNVAWMELMKSSFEQKYAGWHQIEKVTQFFRKEFYVLCFINPELKSVTLFTERMDLRRMHYLQCGIFAFLPWYFDQESGVTAEEMELIQSLREKSSEKFEMCIAREAAKHDFKTARIRRLLAGFEMRYEQQKCDEARRNLASCMATINDLNDQIGSYLRRMRDYENQILGLETKIAEGDGESEIMEYFLCNNHLDLVTLTNTTMRFHVRDYLTYFDEDMARTMIENRNSYVYKPNGNPCNNYIPADDMQMLMTAIFVDQSLRIRFCATYEFDLSGNVHTVGGYNYGSEFGDCTPNTHIHRYNCMGNYVQAINQCLQRHDYIGALEQSIASCKSLNFADSTVMKEFMRRFYGFSDSNVNIRCIELPDGRVVEPLEAIAYLKEENQNG